MSVEASTVRGAVTLRRNNTFTLVAGNRITDTLACSGNEPAPVNNGLPNRVTGQSGASVRTSDPGTDKNRLSCRHLNRNP